MSALRHSFCRGRNTHATLLHNTGLVLAGGHAAEDEGGRMHRDEEVKEVEGRDCGVLVHMFPPLRMNED